MLTTSRLVVRNLFYHWRGNLAVLLGVVVGAAALTGALLVGDSLRGSLRARAERQLGGVEAAALLVRPVRAELADALPDTAPVLLLQGSIRASTDPDAKSVGRVTVLGVDPRFKPIGAEAACDWSGDEAKIVLGNRVAQRLGVKAGDAVHLGVGRISNIPRASLLGRRSADDVTTTVRLTVAAVLPPDSASNEFNLVPGPAAPMNVFVPLKHLQARVDQKGRVTALLSTRPADVLNAKLQEALKPDDWGLSVRVPAKPEQVQELPRPGVHIGQGGSASEQGRGHGRLVTGCVGGLFGAHGRGLADLG